MNTITFKADTLLDAYYKEWLIKWLEMSGKLAELVLREGDSSL